MDIILSLTKLIEKENKKTLFSFCEKLDKKNYEIMINDKTLFIEMEYKDVQIEIEHLIMHFFNDISNNMIIENALNLRIGIFYSLEMYPFFSLDFSKELLKILYENKIEIEINSYPTLRV